ncbi:MAG: MJ1255/VC2487 family glycosyltransferase [Gammaproteobacteria bacterium]
MAKIVYGVSGEGSGHSSRAREIITHLQASGHTAKIVSYGRGYSNLQADFDVFETEGLHIQSVENKVSVVKTFVDNISRLSDGVKKLRELRHVAFKNFQPDAVVTDFEPMTAYLANHYDLPLITIDNQHRMRYMRYSCPRKLRKDATVTETVIRAMVPRPDVSLVTTFYFGELKNERTFLFPPILRRRLFDLSPSDGEHILVYVTQACKTLLSTFSAFPRERFFVYGYDRDEEKDNLVYKSFSADGFLHDLAGAKAVIATAGFTLMTEALYFRKPILAFPMQGQFEQEFNALLLADLGYGKNGRRKSRETIGDFLYRVPDYREQLARYRTADNHAIFAELDELLARDCDRAKAFHRERKASFSAN